MLDQTPSLEKVTWAQVILIGEQLSKQATIGIPPLFLTCVVGFLFFYFFWLKHLTSSTRQRAIIY